MLNEEEKPKKLEFVSPGVFVKEKEEYIFLPKDEIQLGGDLCVKSTLDPFTENSITFNIGGQEIIHLSSNGDIYVKGNLVENDKEIVDGFREFLTYWRVQEK